MDKFIDSLPKNDDGMIILNPAGKIGEEYKRGEVEVYWFEDNFPELANAEVPLNEQRYNELKKIGKYWKMNAERWRDKGII